MGISIEEKAVDLLEKLEKLSEQYSPEVMDAALGAVQVSAAGALISGTLCLAASALMYRPAVKIINWFKDKNKEHRYEMYDFGGTVTMLVYFLVAVSFLSGGIIDLTNVWNWVALFNPELALAHKVMGL